MRCPLCGNDKKFKYIESLFSNEVKINYKIFKCEICELEFSHPMRPAPPSHYERTEYNYRWEFFEFLKFFKNKKFKLLDIGCGEGHFLKMALENGFEVIGIDFNEKVVKTAKEKFKIEKIYPFTLEEFMKNFPYEKFGIITAFHIIEHLDNPLDFVFKLRKILKENGFFVFSLPNTKRLYVKIKERESWDYPPHHLTRWNLKSIEFLMKKTGFNIVKIKEENPFDLIMDVLMRKIHFNLTRKIYQDTKNYSKNLKDINLNVNKFKNIKRFLFLPIAFILYFPLKFLKIKGISTFIIAQKLNGDNK